MIKNIIFDIGNVLAAFRWKEFIEELGFTGGKAKALAEATTLSPLWKETDRGVMPLNDVIESMIAAHPELEEEIRLFFRDRRRLVMEYDYSVGWIKSLKERGYRIYLLSNYSEDHFKYISHTFGFFGLEDGRVISYQEKLLKPDLQIYKILLDRYSLKPEECVFLDDSADNAAGAEKAGIKGIVFKDYEQGSRMLEELLN